MNNRREYCALCNVYLNIIISLKVCRENEKQLNEKKNDDNSKLLV